VKNSDVQVGHTRYDTWCLIFMHRDVTRIYFSGVAVPGLSLISLFPYILQHLSFYMEKELIHTRYCL